MIISVVNQKGGTAKTTTTINLGSALAMNGYKVLLVDFDAQGSLSYSLGKTDLDTTVVDAVRGDKKLSDCIVQAENFDLLPSNIQLADLELSLIDAEHRELYLSSTLQKVSKFYDYILIDCPPSLSLLTVNALSASDGVLVPMQLDVLSLQGLELILDTIKKIKTTFNQKLSLLGVLPVMVDSRRKLTQEVLDYLNEQFEVRVFQNMIRINVKASEAPSFGQSVIAYSPESNSARDYINCSQELIKLTK